MFLNGPMAMKAQQIIKKVTETKQMVKEAKQNSEDLLGRAQQTVPSLKMIIQAKTSG